MDHSLDSVKFVLCEPRSAGNVGSAARAMMNLGFSRLALVRPRCNHLDDEARAMAVDAREVLEAATVHTDLDAGLEGARTVVGTTRRTGKHRRPHWPLDTFAAEMAGLAAAGELAVLFGREDHGLSDQDLDRCTHMVHIPAAARYPSYNLAQAVLLVAYGLRQVEREPEPAQAPPADHASREAMYRHLQESLRAIGFLHDDSVEPIMRRLRRMLGRACMTPEEVKLLRGVARQTLWVAGKAGLSESDHAPGDE